MASITSPQNGGKKRRRRSPRQRALEEARQKQLIAQSQIVIRPVAEPAKLQRRHNGLLLSLTFCVFTPLLATFIYLWGFAQDQYVSRVGFSVHSSHSSPALELLGGISQVAGADTLDSEILYDFLKSHELVEELSNQLNFSKVFGCADAPFDIFYCLKENPSTEEKVRYWQKMSQVSYDGGAGIIELQTRAFSAESAQKIAQSAFSLSSKMIDELSFSARQDATRYAEENLSLSVKRLKAARRSLGEFRSKTQIIDPTADVQGQMGVTVSLQAQLTEALIDRGLLELSASKDDPRLEQLNRKINVIEEQIDVQRQKVGQSTTEETAYADLVGKFEELSVDVQFAEQSYLQALAAVDAANAEARKRSRYLIAHIKPTLAQDAEHPRKFIILALVGFFAFFSWSIGLLVFYSLRDRS